MGENGHIQPMQIDHNRHEKRPTNSVWWILWPLIALLWAGYFYFNTPEWWPLFLGLGTGAMLATWAIEITGNKWPFSEPPRS